MEKTDLKNQQTESGVPTAVESEKENSETKTITEDESEILHIKSS